MYSKSSRNFRDGDLRDGDLREGRGRYGGDSNGGKSTICSAGWPPSTPLHLALVFKLARLARFLNVAFSLLNRASSISSSRTFSCISSNAAFFLNLEAAALLLFFSFLSRRSLLSTTPTAAVEPNFTSPSRRFFDVVVVSAERPEHWVSSEELAFRSLFFEVTGLLGVALAPAPTPGRSGQSGRSRKGSGRSGHTPWRLGSTTGGRSANIFLTFLSLLLRPSR